MPVCAHILFGYMATIGVYDSGIGGLTTAKIILDRFAGNDLYYLADNLNHPFGSRDEDSLKEVVRNGIKAVRAHSDFTVLACNTASSVTDEKDVFKLLPPIGSCGREASETLILATPRTLSKIKCGDLFKVAETAELATLVEIQASLKCFKNSLDMSELLPYFASKLFKFKGVKNVILGCSHYLYCMPQISKVLGDATFIDGNENLCASLAEHIESKPEKISKIKFEFTSQNEEKKYAKILQILMNKQ